MGAFSIPIARASRSTRRDADRWVLYEETQVIVRGNRKILRTLSDYQNTSSPRRPTIISIPTIKLNSVRRSAGSDNPIPEFGSTVSWSRYSRRCNFRCFPRAQAVTPAGNRFNGHDGDDLPWIFSGVWYHTRV